MRRLPALAALLLCLGGLTSPASALTDVEASKACVECHDSDDLPDMSQGPHGDVPKKKPPMDAAALAMRGSPMADAADPRTPNCISCHGASATHAKKPEGVKERPRPDRTFSKNGGSPAHERSEACQACHQRDAKQALWGGSQHESADVACSSCHTANPVQPGKDDVTEKPITPLAPAANAARFTDKAKAILQAPETVGLMPKLIDAYAGADNWQAAALEEKARAFAEAAGVKLGAAAQPLRSALTGSTQSPPIFEVMEILGKDEAMARLKEAPRA